MKRARALLRAPWKGVGLLSVSPGPVVLTTLLGESVYCSGGAGTSAAALIFSACSAGSRPDR